MSKGGEVVKILVESILIGFIFFWFYRKAASLENDINYIMLRLNNIEKIIVGNYKKELEEDDENKDENKDKNKDKNKEQERVRFSKKETESLTEETLLKKTKEQKLTEKIGKQGKKTIIEIKDKDINTMPNEVISSVMFNMLGVGQHSYECNEDRCKVKEISTEGLTEGLTETLTEEKDDEKINLDKEEIIEEELDDIIKDEIEELNY